MSDQPTIQELLTRVRERVQAREGKRHLSLVSRSQAQESDASYDSEFAELRRNVEDAVTYHATVGQLNPRRSGSLNNAAQFLKRVMRRSLAWYTRPLHVFHGAVARSLEQMSRAVQQDHVRLIELRDHTAEQLRKIEEDYASRARLVDGELRHWRKRLDPLLVRLQQEQETQGERLHAALAAFEDRLRTAEEWSRTILYTADTHQGARARAGLWFNPPVAVAYDKEDRPFWSGTNERVIEKTWTIRQLAAVPKGATLLDLGCSESTLALELASNGYHVTAIDVRSYPFTHPNLQVLESDICKSGLSAGSFDAVISVSTIEHIGLGAYGDSIASRLPEALQEVRRLLRNQGKFFITVPFGIAVVTDLHRVFNSTSLRELLAEFTLEKLEFGRRVNDKVWISPVPEESVNDLPLDGNGAPSAVCMAVCVK